MFRAIFRSVGSPDHRNRAYSGDITNENHLPSKWAGASRGDVGVGSSARLLCGRNFLGLDEQALAGGLGGR